MEKINVAEILRKCPQGMELDSPAYNNLYFDTIIDSDHYPIKCYTSDNGMLNTVYLTKYGEIRREENAKCVIFPKGKTTWDGFVPPCEFKDGDIVYLERYGYKILAIFKNIENNYLYTHTYTSTNSAFLSVSSFNNVSIKDIRFATEEEKEKLFKELKHYGYCWNAKTKTLEKIIKPKFKVGDIIQNKYDYKVEITEVSIDDECYGYLSKLFNGIGSISFEDQNEWELVLNKFDINTLVPFESRVLVRNAKDVIWKPAIFGCYEDKTSFCYVLGGTCWMHCIPYEGNEHLRGKTDDCDEYYKTW